MYWKYQLDVMLSYLSIFDFIIVVVYNFMFNDINMINLFFVIFFKIFRDCNF